MKETLTCFPSAFLCTWWEIVLFLKYQMYYNTNVCSRPLSESWLIFHFLIIRNTTNRTWNWNVLFLFHSWHFRIHNFSLQRSVSYISTKNISCRFWVCRKSNTRIDSFDWHTRQWPHTFLGQRVTKTTISSPKEDFFVPYLGEARQ